MEHFLWTEQYRPKTVSDCVLPERLKKPFQQFVDSKNIPNLMLHGGAGVGKTTIAKAMCNEIGCEYIVINGSDEGRLIDTFRTKIKSYASSTSLTGGRKVIIIDEADYLNPESVQPALRNFIEDFASNCSFIFTCNYKYKIIEPLHSRCSVIDFSLKADEKVKMAAQFYARVTDILKKESVQYDDKVVAEVLKKHFPDFRRVLNELQRYSKFGSIDVGVLSQIGEVEIEDVMKFMKSKDFGALRKWVATSQLDAAVVYRKIFDSMYQYLQPQSIPNCVLILGSWQYKHAFVADPEINTLACLTELMMELEFK